MKEENPWNGFTLVSRVTKKFMASRLTLIRAVLR